MAAPTICNRAFFFLGLSAICLSLALLSQPLSASNVSSSNLPKEKLRIIVDTDIGPWPDDVGALCMLFTQSKIDRSQGGLEILGIVSNNRYEGAVAVIDAITNYFNRSDIPIGITKDPKAMATMGTFGWPQYVLANFPHPKYDNNSQAEDAVHLYRRLLSTAADQSITILSIGYQTNLAGLMATTGGVELIRAKVKNMVVMAGQYPTGEELNIKDQVDAARATLPHWPTPATFVGFEVGEHIACGGNLLNNTTHTSILAHSPVSKAFELAFKAFGGIDGCFDETATLVAIRGVLPFYDTVPGQIEIFPNGTNTWLPSDRGHQVYVKQKAAVSNETIVNAINPLLVG